MKKVLFTSLCVLLLASVASASNTGFKLNMDLIHTPGLSNLNPVSPPYYFFPDGNVANPTASQTDNNWCIDLNDGQPATRVASIKRFNVLQDTFTTKTCAIPNTAFNLVVGTGYLLTPIAGGSTISIVGSHDDSYAANKVPPGTETRLTLRKTAGLSNLNWVSVPYHVMANTDNELCIMVNGGQPATLVAQIKRFNVSQDTFTTKTCAIPNSAFNLVPGVSYSFAPVNDNDTISLSVY